MLRGDYQETMVFKQTLRTDRTGAQESKQRLKQSSCEQSEECSKNKESKGAGPQGQCGGKRYGATETERKGYAGPLGILGLYSD